jgi:hypothetical protein
MRRATRFGLAAVGLAVADGAFAQTTGGGAASTGATATTSSGGLTTSTTGGGSSSGLTTTTPGLGTAAALAERASISGVAIGETTGSRALDTSNGLGAYYANPFFQGAAGSTENTEPGGFGSVLYGTSSAVGGVATGAARSVGAGSTGRATAGNTSNIFGTTATGGMTGRTGGTAGRTGTTGFGGTTGRGATGLGGRGSTTQTIPNLLTTTNSNFAASAQGGQIVPLPRAIAYVADIKFPVAVETPAAVQSNLQTILDRSTQVVTAAGVQVVAEGGGAVTLRGAVKDEDAARLAEGMVRLTPGVRDVRNELTYPSKP